MFNMKRTTVSILPHPIRAIKHKYAKFVTDANLKAHFADRNSVKIITPFLNGLHAEFILIDQLLFVKDAPGLVDQLVELGFSRADVIFAEVNWKHAPTSHHLIDQTMRLYHVEYNIELYVQRDSDWKIVTTADIITTNLNTTHEFRTKAFLSVYDSLYTIKLSQTPSDSSVTLSTKHNK